MKRINGLYNQICSIDNLYRADEKARSGKRKQKGVIEHMKNCDANIQALHQLLLNKSFTNSEYTTFQISEPKVRTVFRLPYYPDRIVQHAIVSVIEPHFMSMYTANTYSCIKGRGVHAAVRKLKKALKDVNGTKYCLKMDIQKFYPSVDHIVLKQLLRRKFKDADLLKLLDTIIDSAPGLPIGNYLSQFLANFYLTRFDHWLKEVVGVKYYFRYSDDIVILSSDKIDLHKLRFQIQQYLLSKLNLTLKDNYQVFPVAVRGIDFLGYKFYHTHTLLRKSIKKRFAKAIAEGKGAASIAAYKGWSKHCNARKLEKTLLINNQ